MYKKFICLSSIIIIGFLLMSCKQSINLDLSQNQVEDKNFDSSEFDFLPTSTTDQIVVHDFYTLSYNERYEQAEWVAYKLEKDNSDNHFKRPYFIEDPKVETGSADYKNYKKSGYDKGHLCAAADMKFNKKAFDDTFYTSNISPQKHYFNDGIWNILEGKVRYWASKYDGIYVVTGGVLSDGLPTIGFENVAVPKYFYKVLLTKTNNQYKMISFLMPNEQSDQPLYKFVISVDALEKMTGIDFYPNLPDDIEAVLEKNNDYKAWAF
jgi:endonuclease G, mitochondrial